MQDLKGTFFVTGTGTGIGKTYTCIFLLNRLKTAGKSGLGLKPISSGCVDGINDDALALQKASSIKLPMDQINPFSFQEPIAPHIASARENVTISVKEVISALPDLEKLKPHLCLIEGAGGWEVPLNEHEMWSDFVKAYDLPVILVVGMTLGCINHALLTERAIVADNCLLSGWIANPIDPHMSAYAENLQTLKARMQSRFLGEVSPH